MKITKLYIPYVVALVIFATGCAGINGSYGNNPNCASKPPVIMPTYGVEDFIYATKSATGELVNSSFISDFIAKNNKIPGVIFKGITGQVGFDIEQINSCVSDSLIKNKRVQLITDNALENVLRGGEPPDFYVDGEIVSIQTTYYGVKKHTVKLYLRDGMYKQVGFFQKEVVKLN